ncbi:MAG TPA: DUF4276 family protein [Oligoflexus sp.]|uniref:DUF4276 family protein n=1 Tax=Oligoflexus sp. TaxID=1971216 RepID=UPI002D6F39EA|nr:DUF4276 family protein [Oligoflexus sp.]HYX37215.1 DUF4276 family protein [Oligoflexus sp.]
MPRLFVLVEGPTEEMFVNEILAPHLYRKGFHSISARIFGSARARSKRGGVKGWDSTKVDFTRILKQSDNCYVTTIVDYYGMPSTPGHVKTWPGRDSAEKVEKKFRAEYVEKALKQEIIHLMGANWDPSFFIPFVALHEFEAWLFSDCQATASALGIPSLSPMLQVMRDEFETPEEINDTRETSPSHRILALMPEYEKPLFGNLAILGIGLEKISFECPHFAAWLKKLENLIPKL